MKKMILAFIAISLASICAGQTFFRNLEFELGPSVIFYAKENGAKVEPTWNLFTEVRYNLNESPLDVGVHFGLGAFSRDWNTKSWSTKNYHFKNLILASNYNFRKGKNTSPYVGLGVGISRQKIDVDDLLNSYVEKDYSLCFMPRVGVEFFRTIRISSSYKFMKSDYSNFECSLGFTIGGWKNNSKK
jgi:hypothetical protein